MKWAMDVHKYMSEITRKALKIIVDNHITSESEPEEIDRAERELADAHVYQDYESAKGRIRRALFTYFKAYDCLDDNENLTEMGQAFVNNQISVQEFSFWYVLNYKYSDDETSYYPAKLILKFIKMISEEDPEQAFITPYDFQQLTDLNGEEELTNGFVNEQISARNNGGVSDVNERRIGFDVWAKMFTQSGILYRDFNRNLKVKNNQLVDWILDSYNQDIDVVKGKIATGILNYLPVPVLGNAEGDTDLIRYETSALSAFLFEGVDEHIINHYIIRNHECSLDNIKSILGLTITTRGFYMTFLGLERLVGFCLIDHQNPVLMTIGELLIPLEFTEESLDEYAYIPEINEEQRLSTGTNVLIYGVPGSGKSWTIEHEYCKPGCKEERLVFHPDYTYSDFVGQILPAVAEDGQVSYEFTPGPFTNILREAYLNPTIEYILVIEEINRGNAPAIFGEIFQLLDRKIEIDNLNDDGFPIGTSEYGITNENIAKIVYCNPQHKVRIPSNLSIIATMNTSDQNVFTLDTAFQRRWNMRLIENTFDNVDPALANAEILDTTITWKNFCTAINNIVIGNSVRMTSAEDKRLGAYFVHLSDLRKDDNMADLSGDEYNSLLQKESSGTLSETEAIRLKDIRDAMKQYRKFPEKVIKYLWDDAFKFNREAVFENLTYQSLEQVIRVFMYSQGIQRFKMFKDDVVSAFENPDL